MTPHDQIKNELAEPEYDGMSDAEMAAHFNAKTVSVAQPLVTVATLRVWAAKSGAARAIENGIAHDDDVAGSICLTIRYFLTGGGDPLDLSSDNITEMIDELKAKDIFSQALCDSLYALGFETVPLWKTMSGSQLTAEDVAAIKG